MQNEHYRKVLAESCHLIHTAVDNIFQLGMDIALCGELKDVGEVLEDGDAFEFPLDMLLTMHEPLLQQIGKSLIEAYEVLTTLQNLNNIGDEELTATKPATDGELSVNNPTDVRMGSMQMIQQIIESYAGGIAERMFMLSAYDNYYEQYWDFTTCNWDHAMNEFKAGPDQNLRLLESFHGKMWELYGDVVNDEIGV